MIRVRTAINMAVICPGVDGLELEIEIGLTGKYRSRADGNFLQKKTV